ncbi:monooxygenase, FAD-binding protein [Minicystis rosea]|nr:monooxygenase, FAD-binding protein [Minicystis rosea]
MRMGDVKIPGTVEGGQLVLPDGTRPPFGLGVPLGDGYYRVMASEPYPEGFDRDAPVTLDDLAASVQRVFGLDLRMHDPRWLTAFTDASRQAASYRAGRVFVAGDAAHIHFPAGGPGIRTGINDAANLGWKLAAEIRGFAPRGLLDTYHTERHPVGARVLQYTRAQGALMTRSPHVVALRELLGEMLQGEQAVRFIVERLQGTDARYDMGEANAHPIVGGWLPDVSIETEKGARRLSALLHHARAVLVLFSRSPAIEALAAGYRDRIDIVTGSPVTKDESLDALLIRPDGHVAWAAARAAEDEAGLSRALHRWFGEPRREGP